MRKVSLLAFFTVTMLLLLSIAAMGQATQPSTGPLQQPVDVDDNFLPSLGAQVHFESDNKTAGARTQAQVQAAMSQNRIISVPLFSKSFTFQGQNFPFTMVGRAPERGDTTRVETQLIPVSLFFEGFADAQGNPIVLDVTPKIANVRNSPNFRNAEYASGNTQFGDAVQRAEFFHVMERDWHTLLNEPRQLTPVTIDVPKGSANLFRSRASGVVFAVVDEAFFISQLNTIIQLENLDIDALPLALTVDVFLAPGAQIRQCCVLGFHTAFDAGTRGNAQLVQTFAWASWTDAGIFGGNLADITPMSHEISEWFNDPFGNSLVPPWTFPNGAGGCQGNLETGDPIEVFANSAFPVQINGFVYHPQTEALLQWFERKNPSDAVDGAFSFPDQTLLTGPAQNCPAP